MHYMLAIKLNGIAELEYDRAKPLDLNQSDYLDNMDEKMNAGISLEGENIETPTQEQKNKFVASNLYQAIKSDNEGLAGAMTTYLAVRDADLKQVIFQDDQEEVSIKLVYDEVYNKQVAVKFN